MVFHWRREYRDGRLAEGGLVPVVVTGDKTLHEEVRPGVPATIRIDLPSGAVVSIEGSADPALIQAVVRSLRA